MGLRIVSPELLRYAQQEGHYDEEQVLAEMAEEEGKGLERDNLDGPEIAKLNSEQIKVLRRICEIIDTVTKETEKAYEEKSAEFRDRMPEGMSPRIREKIEALISNRKMNRPEFVVKFGKEEVEAFLDEVMGMGGGGVFNPLGGSLL